MAEAATAAAVPLPAATAALRPEAATAAAALPIPAAAVLPEAATHQAAIPRVPTPSVAAPLAEDK